MRKKSSFKLFEAIDQMIASGAPPGSMLIADDIDNPKKFVIVEGQDMKSNIKPAPTKPKNLIDIDKTNNQETKSKIENDDYHTLKEVPPETEWLQERRNRSGKTANNYQFDVNEFKEFLGIKNPEDYRKVSRQACNGMDPTLKKQKLTNETIGRKISAVSSLFKYYCERVRA